MTTLKKELKRARLFEVQKLTRRIRSLEKRRGTALQLEKNQRKVQRLQHELELVKNVDISELCSRIQAKDEHISQLTTQQQAPADCEEKAKWRMLSSKTLSRYLTDLLNNSKEEESLPCEPIHHGDRVPEYSAQGSSSRVAIPEDSTQTEERGRERCMMDEGSTGVEDSPTIDRKADSSREKGLSSTFLTSLSSGIKRARPSKKPLPHGKRKAVLHRNRLGQRARRKLWEEKYGRSAKHLAKTKVKRSRVGAPDGRSRMKVQSSSESGGGGGEKSLHPSWTAKKQQQTAIQQFQGQKIVFDSD